MPTGPGSYGKKRGRPPKKKNTSTANEALLEINKLMAGLILYRSSLELRLDESE
jgi:hypothetical protein